jgi:hypothetical protein
MKLMGITARPHPKEPLTELVVELDGVHYECVRIRRDSDAAEVAEQLRLLAARVLYRATHTPAPRL